MISDTINAVSNLSQMRGFTEKEIETALQNLKRLKAKAHRQDVSCDEIINAVGIRISPTLKLLGGNPYNYLKLQIMNCRYPLEQNQLMEALDSLVKYFYSCHNVQAPEGMLFKNGG